MFQPSIPGWIVLFIYEAINDSYNVVVHPDGILLVEVTGFVISILFIVQFLIFGGYPGRSYLFIYFVFTGCLV